MSGIIWDDMERLKLAIGRWADEEREDQSPPEHVRIAMDHLEDTIAEAWPPEPKRGMPWKPEPMVVVRRGWAETIPQLEAAEPEPDPAAVVYCGGKTLVWTGPPSPQPVAAEDMAEAKHVISGWGQTDLAIEKAAGRPFPAFHVATLDTLKASKVPADVNCVTVWGIRAEGDVPPFMMRRRDRPQVAEPVQQAVTAWPPSPSVVDMTFLGVGAVAEKAASAPVPDVPQRIDAEECQRRLRITEAKILEQEAKEFWTKERQKAVLEAYRGQAGIFHLGK